ncbi:SDR family NAD(P)-dependent oxidoreductase [Mongoliimonas terrestris]|uniref:SDR family NAD(P)-dependent oxidoreductase n=1 Tax=Mongoliimonas terrestris TaxID=1709001 RepID=UPI0009495F09|nr:SDR family oxidoreductase [Mongoliimonas terrestris]
MPDTYLIYGGTGGLGSAIARRLVGRGAAVHLVARDEDRLKAFGAAPSTNQAATLSDSSAPTGSFAGYTAGDVADPETFIRAMQDVGDKPLKGLVYAVGTINLKPLGRLTDEDFLNDYILNTLGAARAIRAAVAHLARAEGTSSVLLFSTVAARQGFAAHASVAAAKGGVEGLVHALGAELAPKIRVNAIAPSLVETELSAPLIASEPMRKAIAGLHALPRLGTPDDIAGIADMLLSDGAAWITGQIIGIDGGRSTLRTKG